MKRRSRNLGDAELERLQGLVEDHQRALGIEPGEKRSSRRNLLKLAGAALAGAAGVAALDAMPASASNGGNVVLGATNNAESTTVLNLDGSTASVSPILSITRSSSATTATDGIDVVSAHGGTGISASSDSGYAGLFASTSGVDVGAGFISKFQIGSGRISQVGRTDFGSSVTGGFNAGAGLFETVRGSDASIWASRATGTTNAAWKRMNTLRVDNATNNGAPFAPVRVVNTDPAVGAVVGGITGPLVSGNTYSWTLTGANGIPNDAIGIVGNITSVAYTSGGFLTMFPKGATRPTVSSVNFAGTFFAWGNAFTVGFGSGANAGAISIYIGLNNNGVDTCHVIVDVFGYIQ